jgi:hypothetical protein
MGMTPLRLSDSRGKDDRPVPTYSPVPTYALVVPAYNGSARARSVSQMRESNRFVRGMFSWIGLSQTGVVYTRQKRFAGETKYPLRKMARFAATGVISFSAAPLRAALNVGIVISFLSFRLGMWSVVVKLSDLYNVPAWTSIVVLTTLIGGIQLIVLVIGEYIGDIHTKVKAGPLYVIGDLENLPARPPPVAPRNRCRPTRAKVRGLVTISECPDTVRHEHAHRDRRDGGEVCADFPDARSDE